MGQPAQPLRGPHPDIERAGLAAAAEPSAERRAAEEAQRFLASIVACSEDAIVANAPVGTILTWNRGARAMLGYSAEEAIGRNVSMPISPEARTDGAPFIEQVLKVDAVSQREGLLIRKDGRRVDVSLRGSDEKFRQLAENIREVFTAVFDEATAPAMSRTDHRQPADGRFAAQPGVGCPRRDARILVAEDNPTNQLVLLAQLGSLGYQARAVANGVEAVEAARLEAYDLVLMDCQMPEMDGFEATRRIRQSDRPHVPVVAVTADAMVGDRERCIREGMDDYLAKPVALDPLADVLATWLPGFTPRNTLPAAEPSATEQAVAVFDEEDLLSRLLGDRQIAGVILQGFLADFPGLLNRLRKRLDDADGPGAALLAHSLKGAAAAVSAGGLRALATAMEQAGKAGQLDDFSELIPRTLDGFERLKSALRNAGWV